MQPDARRLLAVLARLKTDRATGDPAPHKPLLLLALFDLIESGRVVPPVVGLTAELGYQFLSYWRVVAHRRKAAPDVRMPFHHLSGDPLGWEPLDGQGAPSADRKLTRSVRLASETAAAFADPDFRSHARRVLVAGYFRPEEQLALAAILGIPEDDLGAAGAPVTAAEHETAVRRGRDVRFRVVVVAAYEYTCALTGHRLTTVTRGSLVDAAHIHQFADSRNDDPRNGLALSKDAHWMFDQGLWSVADDLTVLVAEGQFAEEHPAGLPLARYAGRPLASPADDRLRPDPTYLAWHRRRKFLGGGR